MDATGMVEVIETMNIAETVERLRSLGMRTSPDKLRRGIQQGVYPFGDCVMNGDTPSCDIYKKLLDAWIAERSIFADPQARV